METTIHNEQICATFSHQGAELVSLRRGAREYIWQGDTAYWGRHAPILFPIVGRLNNNRYRIDGSEYLLPQHGFARDTAFTLVAHEAQRLLFQLHHTPQTLSIYPYPFILSVEYTLHASTLQVLWHIENPSATPIHFQIGAHPAFLYPDFSPSHAQHAAIQLLAKDGADYRPVRQFYRTPITPDGYAQNKRLLQTTTDDSFPLSAESFAQGAWIIEHGQVQRVLLIHQEPYLAITFNDAPVLGIWSPEHKNAPFVCVEPWHGRCDPQGYTGDFPSRDWTITLEGGNSFEFSYSIEIL